MTMAWTLFTTIGLRRKGASVTSSAPVPTAGRGHYGKCCWCERPAYATKRRGTRTSGTGAAGPCARSAPSSEHQTSASSSSKVRRSFFWRATRRFQRIGTRLGGVGSGRDAVLDGPAMRSSPRRHPGQVMVPENLAAWIPENLAFLSALCGPSRRPPRSKPLFSPSLTKIPKHRGRREPTPSSRRKAI